MKVAFIGLGTMGWPMAAHVARAHDVVVCNRTIAKARDWAAENKGAVAETPAGAARNADLVMVCLPTDADTVAVALGADGAFDAMKSGALFVDHGSGSADVAKDLAGEAARRGLGFLDAPVTGGRAGAERATLAALVGGEADWLQKARPAIGCFAARIELMGGTGAGHITKMVNVIIGHGNGVAMAEALGFAIRSGLDPARTIDVLMQGSSRSWQLEHRGPAMIARDYRTRYPIAFARKDLGNVLAEGRRAGAPLPLSALADEIYAVMIQRGWSEADAASLIEYFAPLASAGDGAEVVC